jgi:hypothetical protein
MPTKSPGEWREAWHALVREKRPAGRKHHKPGFIFSGHRFALKEVFKGQKGVSTLDFG